MTVKGQTFKEGDMFTLNGSKGYVYQGQLPMISATESGTILCNWTGDNGYSHSESVAITVT